MVEEMPLALLDPSNPLIKETAHWQDPITRLRNARKNSNAKKSRKKSGSAGWPRNRDKAMRRLLMPMTEVKPHMRRPRRGMQTRIPTCRPVLRVGLPLPRQARNPALLSPFRFVSQNSYDRKFDPAPERPLTPFATAANLLPP